MPGSDSPSFEWDPRKAERNLQNHELSFDEATSVFSDPLARIFDDPRNSEGERREVIIGHSETSRLILVFFTERSGLIRIFSARPATKKERRDYEENTQ